MEQKHIEGFRISPEQKHLWQLSQEASDSSRYCVSCTVRIKGPLQRDSLHRALQHVIHRHEILRTTFQCAPDSDLPVQIIHESPLVRLAFYDLAYLQSEEQQDALTSIVSCFLQLPSQFSAESLLTSALLSLNNSEHLLVLSLPALCGDVTTLKNIVHELAQIYEACEGKQWNAPVFDEVMQYADLAEWRHEILAVEDSEVYQEYWNSLRTLLVQPRTLIAEQQSAGQSVFDFRVCSREIATQMLVKLSTYIQQHSCDLEAFLLTAWSILLKRFSAQDDLIIYISRDIRDKYDDIINALGPLTKVLPLAVSLQEHSSFDEAMKTLCAALRTVTDRQEYFSWDLFAASPERQIPDLQFPSYPVIYLQTLSTKGLGQRYTRWCECPNTLEKASSFHQARPIQKDSASLAAFLGQPIIRRLCLH